LRGSDERNAGTGLWSTEDLGATVCCSFARISGDQVSGIRGPKPIYVGLVADEPIRLAGLISAFEGQSQNGQVTLIPVPGALEEMLSSTAIGFLLLDLRSAGGLKSLELIRRARPDLGLVVLGPEGNDNLVLDCIVAGARAYLDPAAEPEDIRTAIHVMMEGSIWAPRRLLSKLIDRLLSKRDTSLASEDPHLTLRERQVLELILKARSNREIASQLGIEERTVKAHVGRLMRKAGVENRIELSMRALSRAMAPGQSSTAEEHTDPRQITSE
jgi:DNA-binding NarL/FixJ family response regulator